MLRSLLTAAILSFAIAGPVLAEDEVVNFADTDAEMNAAIEKARSTLPTFWSHFAAPGAGEADFSLKLELTDGENVEHFWCADVVGNESKASCVIANEPAYVHTVALGQRVDVDPAQISDWMYVVDGKFHGAQTLRVIVTRLPEDQAAEYRAMLHDE